MSENTLVQKITTDADAQVAQVQADADAQVAVIKRDTDSKIAALQTEAAVLLEKKKEHLELVHTSQAKQAGNIALQAAKRKHIDALFAEVFADCTTQSAEEYIAFYTAQAKAIIPPKATITAVQAPAAKETETQSILTALGISAPVTPTAAITAGLIFFAEDGVYDISFDRLFAEKRAELEMVIVNELVK